MGNVTAGNPVGEKTEAVDGQQDRKNTAAVNKGKYDVKSAQNEE